MQWTIQDLVGGIALAQYRTKVKPCIAGADSIREVAEYVLDLKRKWFHLGLSLGLHYFTLKDIEASNVEDHMTKMLAYWLDNKGVKGSPSWMSLAQALSSPLVKGSKEAHKILTEHPHVQT